MGGSKFNVTAQNPNFTLAPIAPDVILNRTEPKVGQGGRKVWVGDLAASGSVIWGFENKGNANMIDVIH